MYLCQPTVASCGRTPANAGNTQGGSAHPHGGNGSLVRSRHRSLIWPADGATVPTGSPRCSPQRRTCVPEPRLRKAGWRFGSSPCDSSGVSARPWASAAVHACVDCSDEKQPRLEVNPRFRPSFARNSTFLAALATKLCSVLAQNRSIPRMTFPVIRLMMLQSSVSGAHAPCVTRQIVQDESHEISSDTTGNAGHRALSHDDIPPRARR